MQAPTSSATDAELAWHFFLPSMTSGYVSCGLFAARCAPACIAGAGAPIHVCFGAACA